MLEEQNAAHLSVDSMDILLTHIKQFIENEFQRLPTTDELINVCRAVTLLFPSLQTENGPNHGIVSIIINFQYKYVNIHFQC